MPIEPIRLPAYPTVAHPAVDEPVRDPFSPPKRNTVELERLLVDEKLALLVGGVNYPRKTQGNADPQPHQTYFKLCMNYKDYLLAQGLVDRVIFFDFVLGETRSFYKGGPKDGQVNASYERLRIKNYRFVDGDTLTVRRVADVSRYYFTAVDDLATELTGDPDADVKKAEYVPYQGGKERSLSVSDVYGIFRVAMAAQIKELHFIGHAIANGPVIVNTDEYQSKYYDKDARRKDFSNPKLAHVFDATHLPHSRAAFVAAPVVCVWGCENSKTARDLIVKAWAKQEKGESIAQEVTAIKGLVDNTYAALFAKKLGFPVLSALPGTYSVHEAEPNDDPSGIAFKPAVMHVNMKVCERIMEFYAKNLGSTFATTGAFQGHPKFGRGYAYFNP